MRYLEDAVTRRRFFACMALLSATAYFSSSWQPHYYKLEWDSEGRLVHNPLDVQVPVYQPRPYAWFTSASTQGPWWQREKTFQNDLTLKVRWLPRILSSPTVYEFQWLDTAHHKVLGQFKCRTAGEWLTDVQLSPDGRYLALAWSDGQGAIYSTRDLSRRRDISASYQRYRSKFIFPWGYCYYRVSNGWRSQRAMQIYFSPTGRYVYYREPDHVTSYRIRWF